MMPTNKMYGLLKILCEKGTIKRSEQNIIKSKWYFDFKVMKLHRAGLVTLNDGSVTLNFRGKVW